MYKIMIIDDDIPMLKYLRTIVDWNELGLELVYESSSSVQALEVLEEMKPHMILTDIGLPQMDGIELATKVREHDPLTRVIFLTCHEDFHYAKKAVRLKADDYLIKDELTPKQLEDSLLKAISQIEKQTQTEEGFYKENVIRNIEFLKETFIHDLTREVSTQLLDEYIAKLNMSWKDPHFKIALGYLPQKQGDHVNNYHEDIKEIYDALLEYFKVDDQITVFVNEGHVAIFMNYQQSIKFEAQSYLNEHLEMAIKYCDNTCNESVSFITTKQYFSLDELGKSYQQLIDDKHHYFYHDPHGLQVVDVEEAYTSIPLGNLLALKKDHLLEAVKNSDPVTIKRLVNEIEENIRQNNIEPKDVLKGFIKFMLLFKVGSNYFDDDELFTKQVQRCWSMSEAVDVFKATLIKLAMENQPLRPTSNEAKKIYEIDDYIANNLTKNIRAVDMAKHLYFNPSYFSRYFKRLTGDTFTDHVHRYKMKAACRYLLNSNEPIENIGLKVGFQERTYFSKVFKKYIGETPSQYRNSHKIV